MEKLLPFLRKDTAAFLQISLLGKWIIFYPASPEQGWGSGTVSEVREKLSGSIRQEKKNGTGSIEPGNQPTKKTIRIRIRPNKIHRQLFSLI